MNGPSKESKQSPSVCRQCRVRKVRCNGQRPSCSHCRRLGYACSLDGRADEQSPIPRRRSQNACVACSKRKTRCSGDRPRCTACAKRGIQCQYCLTRRKGKQTARRDTRINAHPHGTTNKVPRSDDHARSNGRAGTISADGESYEDGNGAGDGDGQTSPQSEL
jgi:hypothetical protein